MPWDCSFRFLKADLNQRLIELLIQAGVPHQVAGDGTIQYQSADQPLVENDLIGQVRDAVCSPWQVVTCPADWTSSYEQYMVDHQILHVKEISDGETWFLIPRKHRPHQWKLAHPTAAGTRSIDAHLGSSVVPIG